MLKTECSSLLNLTTIPGRICVAAIMQLKTPLIAHGCCARFETFKFNRNRDGARERGAVQVSTLTGSMPQLVHRSPSSATEHRQEKHTRQKSANMREPCDIAAHACKSGVGEGKKAAKQLQQKPINQ